MTDRDQTTGWRPIETAPRSCRVLICYASGVVEISCQWHAGNGVWYWKGDDGETDEANPFPESDPRIGWQPLPEPMR